MLKRLSCFQFQRASFSDSSHISAKHGIVLFRPVLKYLWGEIYNRVLRSASLFLWSLHGDELAPQFGMIPSMLLKVFFFFVQREPVLSCLSSLFLAIKLTFPRPNQPLVPRSLKVTIAIEQPAFASLRAYLGARYLKDYTRRERELCASTLPGEENPKPCLLSVGT